jgi:hypothetical protein
MGEEMTVSSQSALCHGRKKLQAEVFCHLNEVVCQDFYRLYEDEGEVARWRGHRLAGFDGTYLNVLNTKELREQYTVQRNQHESECVQVLAGVLYDLGNELGLSAALGKVQAERNLLFEVLGQTRPGDVLVMDRGYADYQVIAQAVQTGREVVVRCPRQSFGGGCKIFCVTGNNQPAANPERKRRTCHLPEPCWMNA